jgi:Xaa-Pro aminopeptidase
MKYQPLPQELFWHNRARFKSAMQPGTVAIFNSNDEMPRSGDTFFPFRQNSGLFWLSGIDQEESMVLLFPNCPKEGHEEVLIIRRTNEHIAIWDGHKYTKQEARETSGIEKVYFADEAAGVIHELINLSQGIYLNGNEHDKFIHPVETRDHRYAKYIRDRYPMHQVMRAQILLKRLQMEKNEWEIATIQQAIAITGDAFRRTLQFVKPGVAEYEVEAEITHEFLRRRATGHAYSPIIASGKNACVLHYIVNNQVCQDGEVLLMDFGAEYGNYAADLTRSIPVSGRFTPRQRAVYEAVLRVMKLATNRLVIGNTLEAYNKEVGLMMQEELLQLGLITAADVEKATPEAPAYKKYFMHGTAHHLGLDVHDLNMRYEPFRAGMVFTCEPGIYIPEENLGIRLENNILITENGPVDLFAGIPLEADEIEDWMNR